MFLLITEMGRRSNGGVQCDVRVAVNLQDVLLSTLNLLLTPITKYMKCTYAYRHAHNLTDFCTCHPQTQEKKETDCITVIYPRLTVRPR